MASRGWGRKSVRLPSGHSFPHHRLWDRLHTVEGLTEQEQEILAQVAKPHLQAAKGNNRTAAVREAIQRGWLPKPPTEAEPPP